MYSVGDLANGDSRPEDAVATEAKFPAKLKMLFQPGRYKVLYGGRGGR